MSAAERIAAYQSAVEHPYHVRAYRDWSDHDGIAVGFQSLAEAVAFAASRPEPLIDLVSRFGYGPGGWLYRDNPAVIQSRRLIAHPAMTGPQYGFVPVDDFPQVEP
jgi:hypothetical protein